MGLLHEEPVKVRRFPFESWTFWTLCRTICLLCLDLRHYGGAVAFKLSTATGPLDGHLVGKHHIKIKEENIGVRISSLVVVSGPLQTLDVFVGKQSIQDQIDFDMACLVAEDKAILSLCEKDGMKTFLSRHVAAIRDGRATAPTRCVTHLPNLQPRLAGGAFSRIAFSSAT